MCEEYEDSEEKCIKKRNKVTEVLQQKEMWKYEGKRESPCD